ncbi:MAG: FAD-dependent oxidoreductase [Bacillota bacterium]|nr:FAD-dependent oxidoreductase [Bacillota bacterium]
MKYDFHVIVIGAGSAGLVVANGSARLGAKVALIEREKMGGDCLNAGCVPSKSFLKCAHLAKDIQKSALLGLDSSLETVDLKKVKNRVHSIIQEIAPHDSVERYEGLGVKVYLGEGQLIDSHTVQIGEQTITGKTIVIATGSEPVVPPIKGLDTVPFQTNKTIFDLEKLPEHLIVLGGGPIGVELGQGFQHLGSQVTIIDRGAHLFDKDDPEVAPIMEKTMADDGLKVLMKSSIIEVKKDQDELVVMIEQDGQQQEIRGDQILVSLGRRPATGGLGLEKIGITVNSRGYIQTDKHLRTNIKNIYACGDVTGPYQFTHMAGYQASIVIRNAIFHLKTKVDYSMVPWTTYTKPEVAHIGYTESWGRKDGLFKRSVLVNLADNDRSKAENDRIGFIKLNLGRKDRIIGATLVGEKGGEMIPLVTLAIKQKLSPSAFLGLIYSYPTEAEIFQSLATKMLRESFKPWKQALVKKFFLS